MKETNPLTKEEFMTLLRKSAQPLPEPELKPVQVVEQTSGLPSSDDCNESHTR